MSYRTILVHIDASPAAHARIALAAQLACEHGAHLVGVAVTGVSRLFYQEASADLLRTVLAPQMNELVRRAERELARFARQAARAGVPSHETRLVDDETSAGIALSGRYADLLVVGQADPALPQPPGGDPAPHVLLACPRPLLVVPYIQHEAATGRRVLLAWNGSPEAVRALDAALPILRRAASVTVACFVPPSAPGCDPALAPYLARHGVDIDTIAESAHQDIGERLLSLLADHGSDLLVMGGYGRARLSELLLGGATRTMFQSMTVPVLMAH